MNNLPIDQSPLVAGLKAERSWYLFFTDMENLRRAYLTFVKSVGASLSSLSFGVQALTQSIDALKASGATADRPASPYVGQPYFDTDLGLPIWHNGTDWIDAAGTIV